jgi:Putative zinc-finger
MSCWRFDLRRKMLPYLEGGLSAREGSGLERHLMDCDSCRGLLVRLRAGHQMAQLLARLPLEASDASDYESVATALQPAVSDRVRAWRWSSLLERLATPRMVTALSALVLLQLGLLVVSNRGVLLGERSEASIKAGAIDLSEFRQITIPDLKSNTQPHVATDGYVENVHADQEEGTVAFRLLEGPHGGGSFVVCEIMGPIQMPPPREGSHVRVYGVARYDAQQDRKWYEVNPVLSIVPLKP